MTTPNWQHHSNKPPKYKKKPRMVQAAKKRTKMLIKLEVDKDVVYNQCQAGKYAVNHCKSLEYELADWYYPNDEQYPYIAI